MYVCVRVSLIQTDGISHRINIPFSNLDAKTFSILFKGPSKDPFEFKLNEFPAEARLENYEQGEKKVCRRFASSIRGVLLDSGGLLNYEENHRNRKLFLKFDTLVKIWILFETTVSCGCQNDRINISNLLGLQKQTL